MEKMFMSNKDETARLFKSDIMEFFSRVHWTVPLYIYIPVILFLFYLSIFKNNLIGYQIVWLYVAGVASWTLVEYLLHRFVFHYHPTSETGKKIIFIFHGIHHAYPKDSKRLVMPPSVSIPLAVLFYFIFKALLGPFFELPFFAGFITGYLCYDMTHYAIHHFAIKSKFMMFIKAHHMKHHYQDNNKRFGVSQPVWDYVFQTMPSSETMKI